MTFPRVIRTGSWLAPARNKARSTRHPLTVLTLGGCLVWLAASVAPADARRLHGDAPMEITDTQYRPVSWSDVTGWREDNHRKALKAFRVSCDPILKQTTLPSSPKALGLSLREPCASAVAAGDVDDIAARKLFEKQFVPIELSKLGQDDGFVTGYYEPVIEGSRTRSDVYHVPVYRRPSNLFVRNADPATVLPNKGEVFRKIGRRKLVPYYDRAEIEDGALAKRGLEIAWLKSETDLLFTQIQGSARVRLEDGGTIRINYDAHNGYPYTPVGRALIERNIIPREEMSMQRIRAYMDANPEAAKELRRTNRAYVFFREVQLSEKDEAVGAQGVPLTPGRSIAVDRFLHVYGTPFFIAGELPLESDISKTPLRKLMIAQDTGSAILGPARADLYFGAGAEAGRVSGRIRHPARFVMLVPRSLDPAAKGRTMSLPPIRPSKRIAQALKLEAARNAKLDEAKPSNTGDPTTAAPGKLRQDDKYRRNAEGRPYRYQPNHHKHRR